MAQFDNQYVLAGLLVTNIVIYLIFVLGLRRATSNPLLKVSSLDQAFEALEKSLKGAFPDLPCGFTWGEGIERAKKLTIRIDWTELEKELRTYEAYRYGKWELSPSSLTRFREVVKLAALLPNKRRKKIWGVIPWS
jgi:hypothetical protein